MSSFVVSLPYIELSDLVGQLEARTAECVQLGKERDSLRDQLESLTAALADERDAHQASLLRAAAEWDVPEPPAPANPHSDGEPRVIEAPLPPLTIEQTERFRAALAERVAGDLPEMIARLESDKRVNAAEIAWDDAPKAPPTCPVCHCPGDLEPADEHERRHGVGELAAVDMLAMDTPEMMTRKQ